MEDAIQDLNEAGADEAFRKYAEIAAKFKPLADGFTLGAQVAEDGQKGLFFPVAAAYLEQITGILQELKKAADEVKDNVDEIKEGVADAEDAFKARDVDALITAGEKIVATWDEVKEKFEELKEEMAS